MAFGREGNHVLVNGRELRHWRAGTACRSAGASSTPPRAATSRSIRAGGIRFRTVGGDGGLQEAPVDSETIVIAPGERIDTIVTPRAAKGNELTVDYRLFNRGYGSVEARVPIEPLFAIAFDRGTLAARCVIPDLRRPIAAAVDRRGRRTCESS
jgi:hypothetical protein